MEKKIKELKDWINYVGLYYKATEKEIYKELLDVLDIGCLNEAIRCYKSVATSIRHTGFKI